jgi:5-methylcytosine-specific restriction endonuclease McrA
MRKLRDVGAVKEEVRRTLARQKPRPGEIDLRGHGAEIDALLGGFDEFLPVWGVLPSVFRVARLDANGTTVSYVDNVALPAARHTIELVVEMLNHIRQERGLGEVTMPLFLQPDEIAYALEHPADCHCDEEQEVAARRRTLRRLGRRASKRWLYTGQDVIDRDGRKCTRCDTRRDLHVHAVGGGKSWTDPARYVTLCRRCHVVDGAGIAPAAEGLRFHLGERAVEGSAIRSQLALVFQKARLEWIGVALGREYVVLEP